MANQKLFGFEIQKSDKKEDDQIKSFVPRPQEDGTELPAGARYGLSYDQVQQANTEASLVSLYRDVSAYPEADFAIDDIINETFVADHDKAPVEIRLENLNMHESIKKKIRDEFETSLQLTNFNKNAYDVFRKWYVDGRLYYHAIIDENDSKSGIKELRPIDALRLRRIKEPHYVKDQKTGIDILKSVNEYYVYKLDPKTDTGIKIAKDSIIFVHSGVIDRNKQLVLGHLDKAIKPFNNLRSMEDALVIYRLARAPERRIFYIDVGQMPKIKAEQYLRDTMNRYRNKIEYDASSGQLRDQRKHMSLLEDFWLPRRDGSKGTQIETLPGGQNLGEIEDVQYFKQQLYKALNVPISRLEQGTGFQLGRASEISRDELKFAKFVGRLRRTFSELFNEILKTQLVLKGVCTVNEWTIMKQYITYDFVKDTHFKELKEIEMMSDRLNVLQTASEYVGKYFSINYVRSMLLGQSEEEIMRLDREIMDEIKTNQIKGQDEIEPLTMDGTPANPNYNGGENKAEFEKASGKKDNPFASDDEEGEEDITGADDEEGEEAEVVPAKEKKEKAKKKNPFENTGNSEYDKLIEAMKLITKKGK